jgi:hypothetical protein
MQLHDLARAASRARKSSGFWDGIEVLPLAEVSFGFPIVYPLVSFERNRQGFAASL